MFDYRIYNSRNYKGLLDSQPYIIIVQIYNSRNYKGLLDLKDMELKQKIYNSRNYKGLLDRGWFSQMDISTTVEIIRVS